MSRRTRKNIGLVGLGLIGSRVREVLRNKGFQVFVWNRTPRPVPNFVGAPAELAEMCDFIQVFVSDDDALLYIVKQLSPALLARHIVIAHPTVSPHTMVAAAEIVERRGARFIEAPFTGSKEAALKGELVYYVGGDEAVVNEARPLLEASSKEVLSIGEVGQATAIKVATNMVTAATVQAVAEALALVQATGLPAEKFVAAMQQNATFSKTVAMKLPKMIERNFERHFSVDHMLKDMQIASRLGLANHLELGVTAAARDRLLEQAQRGHGDEDYSAVARKYSQEARNATEAELELFQRRNVEPPKSPEVPQQAPTQPAKAEPMVEHAELNQPEPAKAELTQPEIKTAASAPNEPPHVSSPQPDAVPHEANKLLAPAHAAAAVEAVSNSHDHAVEVSGAALEALQAHVPAAPFLHTVGDAESQSDNIESADRSGATQPEHEFLPDANRGPTEAEGHEARGFFSRLLRRANS